MLSNTQLASLIHHKAGVCCDAPTWTSLVPCPVHSLSHSASCRLCKVPQMEYVALVPHPIGWCQSPTRQGYPHCTFVTSASSHTGPFASFVLSEDVPVQHHVHVIVSLSAWKHTACSSGMIHACALQIWGQQGIGLLFPAWAYLGLPQYCYALKICRLLQDIQGVCHSPTVHHARMTWSSSPLFCWTILLIHFLWGCLEMFLSSVSPAACTALQISGFHSSSLDHCV